VSRCVIVGGGQAAAQTAISLRKSGFAGEVCIVGEEPRAPYQRPLLSKTYLAGKLPVGQLAFRPEALYAKLDIHGRWRARVTEVDRSSRKVRLDDGSRLGYETLVLATGARPRRLDMPGADDARVMLFRSAEDADRARFRLKPGLRVVIVGGGYLGLEIASVAVRAGALVTVLEGAPTLLARVAGAEVAEFFTVVHRSEGVEVVTGAQVTRLAPTVDCADGSVYATDLVIVAVGAEPRTELALAAGLPCDDGVLVDECGRTEDPAIFAAGDCTNHPSPLLGRRVRLECVQNAVEQPKATAAAIAGTYSPYAEMPWFWSDQYEHKLQTVGLVAGHAGAMVRGDPSSGSFSVLYIHGDRVLAVDAVNAPKEFVLARSLLSKERIAEGGPTIDDWRAADVKL
jgi:3-phenylpropionate/trans-cinnamate dioxygenase ferredoxin reductase subunit